MDINNAVLGLIRAAISERLPVWASLAGAVGLFTYTAINPEPWRLATAATYSVLVYLPILLKSYHKG